jgi:predicted nuclease of predicted toxin-antitoxin system
MRIRFYIDEDVPVSFAKALLNRGVNVTTTQNADHTGNSDLEQLIYANENNRVILTHNKRDFIILHKDFLENDRPHSGIIVTDQLPVGTLLKRTMKLWFTLNTDEMKNRLEFLSNWK